MTPAKADKRTERYHYLRSLGWSAKDAKLWSHRKGERESTEIDRRYTETTAVPARDRTPNQRQFVERVNATRRTRDSILFSRSDKLSQWSKWSDKFGDGFPKNFADQIAEWNGRNLHGKYGYRRMFFLYIEGEDISDAEELINISESMDE